MPDDTTLEKMSDDVLFCKARRNHDMRILELKEGLRYDEVHYICQQCGRERHDQYTPNGELLARWYTSLPGSKVSGLETSDYRKEMFRRLRAGGMGVAKARPRLALVGEERHA